jgi:hypothetical protein
MKFPMKVLRLVSHRSIVKEGKTYNFVKLADEETFDSNEFMLSADTRMDKLLNQTRYEVELSIDGRFTSVNLFQVQTVPEAPPVPESKPAEVKKAS